MLLQSESSNSAMKTIGRWEICHLFRQLLGFWIGILFLLTLDHLIPHLHVGSDQAEGPEKQAWPYYNDGVGSYIT